MSESTASEHPGREPLWPLFSLGLVRLLIHLAFNGGYHIFRDELYFIACGRRLDWGYVDHPPFTPLMARLAVSLFGESMFAIRLPSAIAGALTVILAGLIVRELGGRIYAQCLGALATLIVPVYLGAQNMLSIVGFEPVFWGGCLLILIRILRTGNQRLWLPFGLVAGLGLQNKATILLLGFGVLLGLLLTEHRRMLTGRWPWLAAAVAFLIILPNVIWQAAHDWPTLEFMRNAGGRKNMPVSPLEFFLGQVVELHPFVLPIWLIGVCWYLFAKDAKRYRALGWAFVVMFIVCVIIKAKTYYLAPAFLALIASGSLAIERFLDARGWRWPKPAIAGALVAGGAVVAPYALPILPPAILVRYMTALGLQAPQHEKGHIGAMPQHFGDMFGWEEMVSAIGKVYNELSAEEQAACGVFVENYGQAAAIDFYGHRYGLPNAICGHNNYYLWGPGDYSGEVMIVLAVSREELVEVFEQVEQVGQTDCEFCMGYENNRPIFLCRRPKVSLKDFWPRVKSYI